MRLLIQPKELRTEIEKAFKGRHLALDDLNDWQDTSEQYDAVVLQGQGYANTKYHWEWALSKSPAYVILIGIEDTESIQGDASRLWQELKQAYRTTERGGVGAVHLYLGKLREDTEVETEYLCVHRSEKPVRSVGCKPCQTLTGKVTVPVYRCQKFDCECTVSSAEIKGQGPHSEKLGRALGVCKGCTVCRDREPSQTS